MERYDEYKDSQTTWMGQVPNHWKLERAKWHFTLRNERGNNTPVLLAATQKYGMYPQDMIEGVVKVAEGTDFQQFRTVHKNDFVISLRSFQGGFERSDYEGVCSPAYQVFYADTQLNKNYLKYLFKNELFVDAMNALTVGIREGRNIKFEDFANSIIAIPPMAEQEAIAEYLNRKITHIDSVIEEAKSSIEEYKAWKASIIYEAVTKGLDPNVEMRDSGVEWIGKIPSHWKCTKVRQIAEFINGFAFQSDDLGSEGKYPVVKIGDIQDGKVNFMSCQCTSLNEELSGVQIKKEDILLAMSGATVGKVGYVFDMPLKNSYINQRVGIYRMKETPKFYFYIFSQPFYVEYALLNASGTAQPNISTESAKNFFVPIPPLNERETICKYLDKICPNIDEVIANKKALIEDLESYKKSLIFEVVTGKRKVV